MKKFKYFAIAIMAVCLAACGGKKGSEEKEEIVLTPETTQIKGDLSSSDDEFSSSDDDDDTDSYSSSSSGSQDWDALLNSYEQYVDKYISYMKKAAKGDMSALSEYPALMEKAQDLSNKMSGAQGDTSAAQWARYMKITNKMAQAAANMQ